MSAGEAGGRRGPLAGVRIADFTWIGAGAYTTKLFADFGADVIKVESATRMDPLRSTAPFKDGVPGIERSGYFADRNSNKRAIRLDLKHPEGRRLARALIARSEVVANNFTPGTMDRLGLGYDVVSAERPDIVYLSMSMQGATGPDRGDVGFGLTIAALTGLLHLSGPPDRPPIGTGTNYPDHVPNPCHAAFAVLAALHHRRRTGRGQFIDLAQTEPTIALLGTAITDFTANGRVQGRVGNAHPLAAPHGAYPCLGGRWIAIAARTDAQWRAIAAELGLTRDGWDDPAARTAGRDALDDLVAAATRGREASGLADALQRAGVPAAMVARIDDLVERDAQLAHRGHWVRLDHAVMGRTLYNAPPMRLSRTDFEMRTPAPLLGEHTDAVCREVLGLDDDEIRRLRADGVFE